RTCQSSNATIPLPNDRHSDVGNAIMVIDLKRQTIRNGVGSGGGLIQTECDGDIAQRRNLFNHFHVAIVALAGTTAALSRPILRPQSAFAVRSLEARTCRSSGRRRAG